jgi:hypothetical protein
MKVRERIKQIRMRREMFPLPEAIPVGAVEIPKERNEEYKIKS